MEDRVVALLHASLSNQQAPRAQAEHQLQSLWNDADYAPSLVSIAQHDSVPQEIRQAALTTLKKFIVTYWGDHFDEYKGQPGETLIPEHVKARIREPLLALATSEHQDRRVKSLAGYVVSKIAAADFPDEWPDLLDRLMVLISTGSEGQVHGALKVLSELVDDSLAEKQFFQIGEKLMHIVHNVAIAEDRKPNHRALAVKVFAGCLDILEGLLEEYKPQVKAFAEKQLELWAPFFITIMQSRLPPAPNDDEEMADAPNAQAFKGVLQLKLQVAKALMRIRSIFPALLSPHSTVLFQATWEELSSLVPTYHQYYVEDDRQSRLEDTDHLPYTLDFLVLEELDFMQACLRAAPVKSFLEEQLKGHQSVEGSWIIEVMKLVVSYSHITIEEEGFWDLDVNVFLSEETSVTANYTPRTACGDLIIKLGEWLPEPTINGLLSYTRSVYTSTQVSWKAKEASLYVLNQLLGDHQDVDRTITPEAANAFVDFIRYAMEQPEMFLRARGYLVAGSLTRVSGSALQQIPAQFLERSLQAITNDESDLVQVSCIRALQHYMEALDRSAMAPLQGAVITAISTYLQRQSPELLGESEDLIVTIAETLRDAILLDPRVCITGDALDLVLSLSQYGINNFQFTMLVSEMFEEVTQEIASMSGDAYVSLCAKVIPSLDGALDLSNEASGLAEFASELLSLLAEHGPTPLPNGFVQATMPKLSAILLGSHNDDLLKSATAAVKSITSNAHQQLFEWHNVNGQGGLQVLLMIIDRLLSPEVDDTAAGEVGALAAELVEKAGPEHLDVYLEQLLRAVAVRLASATHIPFIQSLTLVFARLSLTNASGVVQFLSSLDINGHNGLQVVLAKWLENSISFSGYDETKHKYVTFLLTFLPPLLI